jgi:hypothetical protein
MTEMTVPDAVNPDGDVVSMRTMPLLDFSDALRGMFEGKKFARKAWPSGYILFFDPDRRKIFAANGIQVVWAHIWQPCSDSLTATDWIEVIG